MADLTRLREMLPQILGAAGGLTGGGNGFAKRWAQLEAEEQQRQQRASQQQIQQEQLGFQRDANTRAQSADQRAQQDQLLQTVNSIRGFLGDETIETPEAYAQREQMMLGLAPRMGVEPGFIQSLRPAPTVYQQRAAKKKLADIEKAYSPAQMQMLEADDQTGAAPLFEVNGEKLTIAQLRERVGTQAVDASGKPVSMKSPVKPDVANTPEEQQIADVIAVAEQQLGRPLTRGEKAQARLRAMEQIGDARRADKPAPDPELGDLRKQLLQTQVDAAKDKSEATQATADRARNAARKTSGDTIEVLNQLIEVKPDGTATLRPGVGNLFGARVPGMQYLPGDTAKAAAALRRLKGRVIIDLLGEMKSQSRTGATGFGQLTERELDLIQGAATTLDSTFISNQTALEELVRIYNIARQAYDGAAPRTTGGQTSTRPGANPFRGGNAGSGR